MMRNLCYLAVYLCLLTPTIAAADDFTIRVRIIDDLVPPTTPTPLSITAVGTYQIDLSWGSSTDDKLLEGYQIFRDGIAIATTTLTTYSDSSLTPETTYSYFVRAFDVAPNYSTSSMTVSTTTLAVPAPPPPSGGGYNGSRVELISLLVEPAYTSASLSWETSRYARYQLRWGTTESYELGLVTNQVYQRQNETTITELEPNTTYSFELIAYDRDSNRTVLARDTFKTLAQPDVTPPPNVSRLRAQAAGDDVVLTWQNPAEDFAYVRIVRNPLFYPTDPNNGFIAYQGSAERHIDQGALVNENRHYYSVFAYDQAGNRSSGATVWVAKPGTSQQNLDPFNEPNATTTSSVPLSISLAEVVISQGGELIRSVDGSYVVDTAKPFTIVAPYKLFPRHLKAIELTLTHPVDDGLNYTFLLRANSDLTAYEATIDDLGFSGTIPLRLSVYDYQTAETAYADGSIISKNVEPVVEFVRDVPAEYNNWRFLLALILVLILIWILLRRWKKDEDKQSVR